MVGPVLRVFVRPGCFFVSLAFEYGNPFFFVAVIAYHKCGYVEGCPGV